MNALEYRPKVGLFSRRLLQKWEKNMKSIKNL